MTTEVFKDLVFPMGSKEAVDRYAIIGGKTIGDQWQTMPMEIIKGRQTDINSSQFTWNY